MIRKCLAIGIILLFVGVTIAPTIAQNTKISQSTSRGNWLYVGGSGPGNYTKIQDAIDNASDGDTVFVYSGYYPESDIRIINITYLTIKGEDKNTTIIDGGQMNRVFHLEWPASYTTLSGFTIQNATIGISIYSENNIITDNIIQNNTMGQSPKGIFIAFADNNSISRNVIRKNNNGIVIWNFNAENNKIEQNRIENNSYGILVEGSADNTFISENTIIHNLEYGIFINICFHTVVEKNNIYQNHHDASFVVAPNDFSLSLTRITWKRNYWGDTPIGPKIIFGELKIYSPFQPYPQDPQFMYLKWLNIEWIHAKKPYDIVEMT